MHGGEELERTPSRFVLLDQRRRIWDTQLLIALPARPTMMLRYGIIVTSKTVLANIFAVISTKTDKTRLDGAYYQMQVRLCHTAT